MNIVQKFKASALWMIFGSTFHVETHLITENYYAIDTSEIGTRCRPGYRNRCLFVSSVESQVIRNTKYKTVGKRVVNQKRNQHLKSEFQN